MILGGLYLGGLIFEGAYTWRGLFLEFYDILRKSAIVILRQQFYLKYLIPIILLCLQCSLSKMRAP